MDKNRISHLRKTSQRASAFWKESEQKYGSGIWPGFSTRPYVRDLYRRILSLIVSFRIYKADGANIPDGQARETYFMQLVDQYSEVMVFFSSSPLDFRDQMAKDFLAFVRDNLKRRLRLLKQLEEHPDLMEDLDLQPSVLRKIINEDEQSLSYYRKIRAGRKKWLKITFYYPMLTLLKLAGMKPINRIQYLHELLVLSRDPDFGHSYEETDGYGPDEELDCLRKWDKERIKWFDSL